MSGRETDRSAGRLDETVAVSRGDVHPLTSTTTQITAVTVRLQADTTYDKGTP
jgi:hypothetical protein